LFAALPESLLPSRVPDLQFDRLSTDVDDPGSKLHADGVVGVLFDCSRNAQKRRAKKKRHGVHKKFIYL